MKLESLIIIFLWDQVKAAEGSNMRLRSTILDLITQEPSRVEI
jgi:hypothetical protein